MPGVRQRLEQLRDLGRRRPAQDAVVVASAFDGPGSPRIPPTLSTPLASGGSRGEAALSAPGSAAPEPPAQCRTRAPRRSRAGDRDAGWQSRRVGAPVGRPVPASPSLALATPLLTYGRSLLPPTSKSSGPRRRHCPRERRSLALNNFGRWSCSRVQPQKPSRPLPTPFS